MSIGDRSPDPYVASPPPPTEEGALTLAGFWDGAGRLYLTREQNQYLQFRSEDVLRFGDVDPGQPPFLGELATWVTLAPDADIEFIRATPASPPDDFAIELRTVSSARGIAVMLKPTGGYRCTKRHHLYDLILDELVDWPDDPRSYPSPKA
jgi:hypothetical protein